MSVVGLGVTKVFYLSPMRSAQSFAVLMLLSESGKASTWYALPSTPLIAPEVTP